MPRAIKAWSLTIVWDTGEEEQISDIPHYAAKAVDEFLDELEDEARCEAERLDALDE